MRNILNRLNQSTNATTQTNVYGSRQPYTFLKDLQAGTNSVDIIIIGDSNTGAAISGGWGYLAGLSEALNSYNFPIYATPLYPFVDQSTTGVSRFYSTWRGTMSTIAKTGKYRSGLAASDLLGTPDASATFFNTWNENSTLCNYGNYGATDYDYNDWLFISSSTNADFLYKTSGCNIEKDHPFAVNGTSQILRVKYGKSAVNNSQQFWPNVFEAKGANASSRLVIGTAADGYAAEPDVNGNISETTFVANGYGHNATGFGYNASGTQFSNGPVSLFFQSIYRPIKGWSVHSRGYQSGATSTEIASTYNALTPSATNFYLKEIRERQIAAGGTGRVMLFVHSGINGSETGTRWTDAHKTIWNHYKTSWSGLGYPASDLAIVSFVGVQKDSADTIGNPGGVYDADLINTRIAANAMAVQNPDMCVVDVKNLIPYSQMVNGNSSGVSYYQQYNNIPTSSTFTAHLSGGLISTTSIAAVATTTTATSITFTGAAAVNIDHYWVGSQLGITTSPSTPTAEYQPYITITGYNGTTKVATINSWSAVQPATGTTTAYNIRKRHFTDGYTFVAGNIVRAILAG